MNNVYLQFSNCIVVRGYNRSVIYDLQRMRYEFVTNCFADILLTNEYKLQLDELDTDLKMFLDELVNGEWGIYTNQTVTSLFPKLSLEWDTFSKITNAHIDLRNCSENCLDSFLKILHQLENLICKDVQINFISKMSKDDIELFLKLFDAFSINSILLVVPYSEISQEDLDSFFKLQPKLNSIFFYAAPVTIYSVDKVNYTSNNLELRCNHDIITDYFTTNIYLFSESQKFNTYYNKKLCIDVDGSIKNTPDQNKNFGNVSEKSLIDVINTAEFKKLWSVNKDLIDVCKDCEFRYMCVDSCNLIERDDSTWYRGSECNYNPYISKWEHEEGYKTLKECGIEVNDQEFKVDYEKVEKINAEVWAE